MTVEHLAPLLESVKTIAEQAGAVIMEIYNRDFEINFKEDNTPLTEADLAAHHCIVAGLEQLQSFPILSEESADIAYSERSTWQTYWLVDPLDGTREFIKKNGDFTVNIALIHQHKPVLGVVYVPVKQESYYAIKGSGAFKQAADGQSHRISVRSEVARKPVVAGSRSHITPELERYLDRLPEHDLISIGSSLKFCLVAEGQADVYPRLGLTSEWDTGAAQCVVEQAGGKVTNLEGKTLEYNTKVSYLNPFFLVFGDIHHDWAQYVDQ